MNDQTLIVGSLSLFAIEVVAQRDNTGICVAASISFWIAGVRVFIGESADPIDLQSSYVYLTQGTEGLDNEELFSAPGGLLGRLVFDISGGDSELCEVDYDRVMRSSLWFHPSLGEFMLLAIACRRAVRLVVVRDGKLIPDVDYSIARGVVDEVLIGAGQVLASLTK